MAVTGLFIIVVNCCKFHANSIDPDQMPDSVASDLDLHCLQMLFLARLDEVQEELLYYPRRRRRHWCWRRRWRQR